VWSGGVEPVLKQPDLPTSGPKRRRRKGREGKRRTTKEVVGLAMAIKKGGKKINPKTIPFKGK